jgi:hypothetical protein
MILNVSDLWCLLSIRCRPVPAECAMMGSLGRTVMACHWMVRSPTKMPLQMWTSPMRLCRRRPGWKWMTLTSQGHQSLNWRQPERPEHHRQSPFRHPEMPLHQARCRPTRALGDSRDAFSKCSLGIAHPHVRLALAVKSFPTKQPASAIVCVWSVDPKTSWKQC